MKYLLLTLTGITLLSNAFGQNAPSQKGLIIDNTSTQQTKDTSKEGGYISVGEGGLLISKGKTRKADKKFLVHYLMFDLGINALNDKTDYSSPAAQQYLQVPADKQNSNLFAMRTSKSINVNIWPVLFNYRLLKTKNQTISLYSGAGMQFYNFRFNKNISYLNETVPMVIEDSVIFSKNKLAFAYVSIPLMLNFKTRLAKGVNLVYGFGAIGGYAFDTWTKQISDERGKQKNHDQFNFQRFNLNLSGEIGISGYIRFYGTYQVTNMYKNSLVQNPYCIGIRFLGV